MPFDGAVAGVVGMAGVLGAMVGLAGIVVVLGALGTVVDFDGVVVGFDGAVVVLGFDGAVLGFDGVVVVLGALGVVVGFDGVVVASAMLFGRPAQVFGIATSTLNVDLVVSPTMVRGRVSPERFFKAKKTTGCFVVTGPSLATVAPWR